MEESSVKFIRKIGHISFYLDPLTEKDKVLVGYKSKPSVDPGYIFIPADKWNEGLKNMTSLIEKDEVEESLRKRPFRNFKDIDFVICSSEDPDTLKKIIESLAKKFKD